MSGAPAAIPPRLRRQVTRRLAFPGAPALVVGRTVVEGPIDGSTLDARIAAERAPPGCASRARRRPPRVQRRRAARASAAASARNRAAPAPQTRT